MKYILFIFDIHNLLMNITDIDINKIDFTEEYVDNLIINNSINELISDFERLTISGPKTLNQLIYNICQDADYILSLKSNDNIKSMGECLYDLRNKKTNSFDELIKTLNYEINDINNEISQINLDISNSKYNNELHKDYESYKDYLKFIKKGLTSSLNKVLNYIKK